jgi:hypothetical protein
MTREVPTRFLGKRVFTIEPAPTSL